jgi:peptide/nickel transport system substrate-binding protein
MAASSVPNGFSTTFLTSQGDRIPEIVQQALAPLKIKVTLKSVDINQIFEIQGNGDYQITDEYWTEDIPDPDERTAWFLNESASHDYFTYYHNAQLAQLVKKSEQTFDETERGALFKQIQAIQASELPQIPLYDSPYQYAYSTSVQGFTVSPLGNFHLEDVWMQ